METQSTVQTYGVLHQRLDRIEPHALVVETTGYRDDFFRQPSAEAEPTKARTQIKALHFADTLLQLTERDAPCRFAVHFSEKDAATRRGIFPRK